MTTLADIRAKLDEAQHHVFHASLPLYILLEKRPRPDNPDWVEVACWKQDGAEGMMVYLSLIDAMIDVYARNRDGSKYQICPFEAIDPRMFIREHGDWFTVYLVYGFAAQGRQLIASERGELLPLVYGTHFHITSAMAEHFHLRFPDKTVAWLEALHAKAEMHDYIRMMQELADSSSAEINQRTHEALQRVGQTTHDNQNITHCTLYDPIERRWNCVAFADMNSDMSGTDRWRS